VRLKNAEGNPVPDPECPVHLVTSVKKTPEGTWEFTRHDPVAYEDLLVAAYEDRDVISVNYVGPGELGSAEDSREVVS
jgi:hypothetical protein